MRDSARISLSVADMRDAARMWLLYGRRDWSDRTSTDRAQWIDRVARFLETTGREFSLDGCVAFFDAYTQGDPAAGCRRKPSVSSEAHVYAILRAFGQWCVAGDDQPWLDLNPMARIGRPKVPEAPIPGFSEDEFDRLRDAARKGSRHSARDLACILLLGDTGMRASELCGLTLDDIDLDTQRALIRRAKGGKTRPVYFGQKTSVALTRYLRAVPRSTGDLLFVTCDGRPFTRFTIRAVCARLGATAGITDCHPHRFRHHCCMQLLRNGSDAFAVQRAMGHSRISVTEVYCKALADEDVAAAVIRASPMDYPQKGGKRR